MLQLPHQRVTPPSFSVSTYLCMFVLFHSLGVLVMSSPWNNAGSILLETPLRQWKEVRQIAVSENTRFSTLILSSPRDRSKHIIATIPVKVFGFISSVSSSIIFEHFV